MSEVKIRYAMVIITEQEKVWLKILLVMLIRKTTVHVRITEKDVESGLSHFQLNIECRVNPERILIGF